MIRSDPGWFGSQKSICLRLHHPVLCSLNKEYYLCCCNISFSCVADILQGCTFLEKSISKHISAEPLWALLLVWKASVCWCMRSGLIVCVCVCGRVREKERESYTSSVCLVPLQCPNPPPLKESLCPGKQHNTVREQRPEKTVCLIWSESMAK